MLSIEQLHSHTCAELVGMCKELGLPHSGRRKQLLVQALFDYQRNNGGIPLPVLARNSFRSHNAAAARYQQQQALLHHQQQQSGPLPANGSVATPVNLPLQKQMLGHQVACAVAGQSSAGGLCGSGGPGFPPPRAGASTVSGGGTGSHHAAGHAAPATASTGGTTSSSDPGGGVGQGLFSRCICKGAAGGSSSRGRISHAKTLKCKTCGYLSHLSCYPETTGLAAQKFVCSTCRMKRLDPFYPVEEVLWETRLEGSHYSVDVCSYVLRKWRAEGKEVIVRCMQLDQPLLYQTWPKTIQISINGRTEETVAAPSWEHKRRDMPVVITQFLKNGKNRLEFWWTNYEEPKAFHLAVLLCTYSSPEALAKTLELRNHVGAVEARRRVLSIVTNKNGRSGSPPQDDDDDVMCMEVTRRIKLLCPITFTRIAVPCRGGSCMHLQCFDLWGFLLVTRNTKAFNTRWKCPECQLYVRPDELVIDDFVLKILKDTPEDATVVELEADGSYRVVSEQELKEESKRAEAQRLRAAGACRVKRAIEEEPSSATSSAPAAPPEDGPTKKAFEIVEMLSSSEDDEEALTIESSSSSTAPAAQTPDAFAAPAAPAAAGEPVATTGTAATGAAPVVPAASAAGPVAASSTSRPAAQDTHAGAESAPTAASNAVPPAAGALPPALVSSLRSAAAAASAAASGGLLFSSAATVAAHHQQHQQRQEPDAAAREPRCDFSPEEEAEEGEDEEDSAIRVGRFYKRLRRTAVSPASPVFAAAGENPATVLQRQVVPVGSTSEGPSAAAAAATGGSLQRTSSPAAARSASASAAAGGAAESAQEVSTKMDALTATSFSSEMLQEQKPPSGEGGDVVVVISSDEEEEPVAAAWTPVFSPQQQRRQQRRQQEQERRRLQDEERQEQRKLVAQAAAAARQHARGRETLPEGTAAEVGAGAKHPQNLSLPQVATLTLLSPPAATDAGAQALLSNVHLSFPATPPRQATVEHALSKDADSETQVGSKAAELLHLLLERQRQELEQREKMQAQQVEQQQQLSLHRFTSLSSEEDTTHHTATSRWQALDRRAESNGSPADTPKSSSSSNRNLSWTLGEVMSTGHRVQSCREQTEDLATGPPLGKSAAATDSPAAADFGGTPVPPPGGASAHRSSASESSGSEQQSSHVHDSRPVAHAANLFFAPAHVSPASFAMVAPPYSFPGAAPPPAGWPCGAAAGVPVAAPFAPADVSHVSSNAGGSGFGGSGVRVASAGSYYYLDPSSNSVASSPVLQQEQVCTQVQQQPCQQQPRQEHVQQPGSYGGTGETAFPIYGNVYNSSDASADASSVLEMYSHALQVQRPQHILQQLQEQVQQAMQESVPLQQHVKEQHGVQEQRLEQQAVHDLQRLQQPRRRLSLSHETVEHAEAAEKQPLRQNLAMVDIRERGETRSDARKKTVKAPEAGAHSSSSRSRRVSARGSRSRSNSMDSAHTDADGGHGMKEKEQYRSESCRQPFPSAQGALLHALSHKADVPPAPAKESVEGRPSGSPRVSTDVRDQPLHERLQKQQQQSSEYDQLQQKQQQQQLRRGMTVVEGGRAGVLGAHSASGITSTPPPAASERTGPALAPAGSQLMWPAAAPVAAPVRSLCSQLASSAVSSDQKTSAAGEPTLTADATATGPAAARGVAANPSVAARVQGANGARRGPRMSLPPRTCIAGLRPDSNGPSKSAASSESDKGAPSAAVSSVAPTYSATSVGASCAAAPRTGVAPLAASTGSVGNKQSGHSRSATNVAAAAAVTPSVAGTSGTSSTSQPRSPARRLLVPPVPPPLCTRSTRQAGSAGSNGQEDRSNSSASKQQGQSTSISNPPTGGSSCSGQPDQEGKISSRLPAAAAATARTQSSGVRATAASATSTTVCPAPAPAPRPPGATAAPSSDAAVGDTTGRQATLRDTGNSSAFVARWGSDTNANSGDGRSNVAVSDVADRGPGPEKRASCSAEGQPGSSNHSKMEGMCSADNSHCSRQTDCASLAVSGRPAAAADENVCSAALHPSQRGHSELRTRSSGSSIGGSGRAETSGNSQSRKDISIADYSSGGRSGVQCRSGASSRMNCSPSSLATVASDCRNPRQEPEGAVCCCSTPEDLHRQHDLPGQHREVEREVSAARHDELREACSKKSGSSPVGTPSRGSKFCSSDGDSKPAQTAGTADTAGTGNPQRTESREAAAASDQPPLVPREAAGGRSRVSVVLAHHAATHPVRPPAGFFSTADSVSVSSAVSGPRGSAEAGGDAVHAVAGVHSGTNDSDVSHSKHQQQKDGATDSPRVCVTKPCTLAISANLGASSCPVTEHIPDSGVSASDGTVPSLRATTDDSFSENENSLLDDTALPLNSVSAGSNWRDAPLHHSCGVPAAFSSSLYAAAEQAGSALRAQQEPQLVSEGATKDLKQEFVPLVTSEGPEREDGGVRADVMLRQGGDTDVRHSSTPLLHSLPQLQPPAQLVWQQQRETTGAGSDVREVGPTAGFTDGAALSRRKAGALCTEEENGREVDVDRGSEGVARCDDTVESCERRAAPPKTEWEHERGFFEHLTAGSETRSPLNAQGLLQQLPSTVPTPVAAGTDMQLGGESFRTFGRM